MAFVTVSVSARYFGPDQYGVLTGALAFASLFAAFGDFGVNTVVTRRVAEQKSSLEELVRQSLGLSIFYSVVLAVMSILIAFAVYGPNESTVANIIYYMSPFIVLQCVGSALTPVFQVTRRFLWYVLAEIAAASATLLGMGILAALNASVFAYVFVASGGSVCRLAVLWFGARKSCRLAPTINLRNWKNLLYESLPIGATSFIGVLYYRIDVILLTLLASPFQVGIYSLAYRVVGVVSTIPSMLVTSSFFDLAESSRDPVVFRQRATGVMTTIIAIISPLVVGGILAREQMIKLIAGAEFMGAGLVLAVLLLATMMKSINTVQGALLTVQHQQRSVLVCGFWSLLVNVVTLVIFVPRYGAVGAGLALLAAEVGPTVYMLYRLRGYINWLSSLPSLFATSLAIALLSIPLVVAVPLPFLVTCGTALALYLCAQILLQPGLRVRLFSIWANRAAGVVAAEDKGSK